MPMHASTLIVEPIGDLNLNHIAMISFNERTRKLAVDTDSFFSLNAVGTNVAFDNREVILSGLAGLWTRLVRVGVGS